ncbi:MAG: rhodanese-like domain-containing protein [Beijerinckiaceae bacterium]
MRGPSDLFDPKTGYRLNAMRQDVPESIPGGTRVGLDRLEAMIAQENPVLLDVLNNDPDWREQLSFGLFYKAPARYNIPGSHWLPDMGRGRLTARQDQQLRELLAQLTNNSPQRPIVFYCIADCWVSWNAARRAISFGYANVHWFREGTDLWIDAGLATEKATPLAVDR